MVLPRHKLRGLSLLNVALVAIVAAIAVTAYFLFFRADEPSAAATRPSVAVTRGDVVASVSSSGTLASSQSASPQFETSGTVTQILVKVGQVVAKGAAIAKVDPAAAERQLRIAEQNQIAAANSVTAADESLDDAVDAREAAEEASASPTPTGQAQAQGQTQNPEVAVSNAEASLARAKADKEQADQDVVAAKSAVAATTLKAPIAGTITAINGAVGSVAGSSSSSGSGTTGGSGSTSGQGSTSTSTTSSAAGTGFADISDLKALQVSAAFPEADAIKIKAGQSATVTLNAEPGTNLTATLASVSPTPTTTNGVVSYSATFSLAKLPANARMGQTANVTVQTAKATDVLYVPSTAVVTTGTTTTVTMADGTSREVEIGIKGGSFTQIKTGLNEGDQVELLQGTIGGTGQTGQGRTGQGPGQFPAGGGQFPAGGVQRNSGGDR